MQTIRRISASLGGPSRLALAASLFWIPLAMGVSAHAQTTEQEPVQGAEIQAPVIPQQVRYAGKLTNRSGDIVEAVFSIYAAPEGGEPLWTETQQVTIDADGSYTVLLGNASPAGLPQSLFAGGAARWLGVSVERAPELARVLLSSVPYAMKSADAQALAGHPAGDFVTQEQLSQFAQLAEQRAQAPAPAFTSEISGTVTGSGTAGTIPMWTGALTQGNSNIVQVGSDIGINEPTPAATLDVNGTGQIRGTLTLPALSTATTSAGASSHTLQFDASAWSTTASAAVTPTFKLLAGAAGNNTATPSGSLYLYYQLGTTSTQLLTVASNGLLTPNGGVALKPATPATSSAAVNSPLMELGGSAYNSSTSGAVQQNFAWQVFPTGNDTATPSGNLDLLHGAGTHTLAPTGLSISPTGVISWASGQTFPITGTGGGTITGITTSSPLTGSGTSGSVALGLNTAALGSTLETTYDARYAQLATDNIFTATNIFQNNTNFPGGVTASVTGNVSPAVEGDSWIAEGSGVFGYSGGDSGSGVYGIAPYGIGVLGVWGGYSGTFVDYFDSKGLLAGVWGDSSIVAGTGVNGTADNAAAANFINNSASYHTLYVINNSTGGTGAAVLSASTPNGSCDITDGDFACTGQLKTLASIDGGARTVETYAVHSAENWMEDFGTGTLEHGVAHIGLEPAFAETVANSADYHVFLTPGGDCKGLYVINKTAQGFEVRESGGGTSSLEFDYRIVAHRRGLEKQRLADVTEHFRTEQARLKEHLAPHPGPDLQPRRLDQPFDDRIPAPRLPERQSPINAPNNRTPSVGRWP
jgi:hypothetical protein